MNQARTEKVATIDELKSRVGETSTAVVTEYRGMTVAQISRLRRSLRAAGGDFKVFKNTLVLRAISGTSVEPLSEFLNGPTAVTFVNGDVSAVAKLLRDFSRETPTLVLKGGVIDGKAYSVRDLTALADLPSRDVLLAQFAGLLASPLSTMAGLLKAAPQSFAYGLKALIESKGGEVLSHDSVEETTDVADADVADADVADAGVADAQVTDVDLAEVTVVDAAVDNDAVEPVDESAGGEADEAGA